MGLCQGKLMTLTKQLFLMSPTLLQAVRPGQGSCNHKKGGPPGIQHPLDRTPSCLSWHFGRKLYMTVVNRRTNQLPQVKKNPRTVLVLRQQSPALGGLASGPHSG